MARDEVGISLLKVYERVEKFVIFIRWLGKSREKILFCDLLIDYLKEVLDISSRGGRRSMNT